MSKKVHKRSLFKSKVFSLKIFYLAAGNEIFFRRRDHGPVGGQEIVHCHIGKNNYTNDNENSFYFAHLKTIPTAGI